MRSINHSCVSIEAFGSLKLTSNLLSEASYPHENAYYCTHACPPQLPTLCILVARLALLHPSLLHYGGCFHRGIHDCQLRPPTALIKLHRNSPPPFPTRRDAMIDLKVACDGGKDSLSMAASAAGETVMAPGNLVVSAYVGMPDITKVVTPDLKLGDNGAHVYVGCVSVCACVGPQSNVQHQRC